MGRKFDDFDYSLGYVPRVKSREAIFNWSESQGSTFGIKALGFRCSSPNKEADELGLHKDGRSRRGVLPCFRPVDNSKKRGLKALPKRLKRLSVRKVEF